MAAETAALPSPSKSLPPGEVEFEDRDFGVYLGISNLDAPFAPVLYIL
jgi:hypothetical protein